MIYKALSIKQPHIHRIINGTKTYEIRSWKTKYRGDLVLCSSKEFDRSALLLDDEISYLKDHNNKIIMGHAIAIGRIKEIYQFKNEHAQGAMAGWRENLFAWEMEIIRKIDPVPVKGKLGIFNIDLPE